MRFRNCLARRSVAEVVTLVIVFASSLARGDTVYSFSMSTEPFANLVTASSPSAPFSLFFFLNSSGGPGNVATLSNFNFGSGGSANLPVTLAFGMATGDAAPGDQIVLADDPITSTLNGLIEGFNPGNTLSFNIDLTSNVSDASPDQFGFAILDSSLTNVLTTDATASSFLTVTLNSVQSAQTFDIDPSLGIGSAQPMLENSAAPLPPPLFTIVFILMTLSASPRVFRRRIGFRQPNA